MLHYVLNPCMYLCLSLCTRLLYSVFYIGVVGRKNLQVSVCVCVFVGVYVCVWV
jgi:hypothetical protein